MLVLFGMADSIWEILTPLDFLGIFCIIGGMFLFGIIQQKEAEARGQTELFKGGASALVFPILFSLMDGLETIVSGACLDHNYGMGMPELDSVIIVGMEYAFFAFVFWIFISFREKKIYNPFVKANSSFMLGCLCDNVAIVFYSYAMAIDAVATDPILTVYPVITILLSRALLKERLSLKQYLCLGLLMIGSVIIVAGELKLL